MSIKKGQEVLLIGPRTYLLPAQGKIDSKFGKIILDKLVGKQFGYKLKVGKDIFTAIEPTLLDLMQKKTKRGPQVVLPKDAAIIAAQTGAGKGWKVLDAGAGSGFLSMFLSNIGCDVTAYEIRKDFYEVAKKNIETCKAKVKILNRDITKGIEGKDFDLITLDMQHPEKAIRHAHKALKVGGWLAVYSMHTEEVREVFKEMRKFNFTKPKIIEPIEREWQIEGDRKTFMRPRTYMIAHTGFLTISRKV